MSISVLGLIAQPVFLLYYILSKAGLTNIYTGFIVEYFFKIWNFILIFLAIRISGMFSIKKTVLIFSIIMIIFGVLSPTMTAWSSLGPFFYYGLKGI